VEVRLGRGTGTRLGCLMVRMVRTQCDFCCTEGSQEELSVTLGFSDTITDL